MTPICSEPCKLARRHARRRVERAPCKECGAEVALVGRDLYRLKQNRVYCSEACTRAWVSRHSAKMMAATNRRYASERMKLRNPMHSTDIRARVSDALRAMKHAPPVRGGNGGTMPEPQRLLSEALGWRTEFVVPTKLPRGDGRPTCYKVDIAEPKLMVAIEVDGASHCSLLRREQDTKKSTFLSSIGWTVLRFTNAEVMADLPGCVLTVLSTISRLSATTTT